MRLITPYGELELPSDFSMTIEKNNPFLSGEGDASLPIALPASKNNLAVLGHLERIDRAGRFNNKVPAILQMGAVQKHGQLVIDTVHRQNGIDVSFAIDSSDLYVQSKSKTLKEIFSEYNNGAGYKETFGTMANAILTMEKIYNEGDDDCDYVVFPVAVSPYETGDEDNKTTVYQYNNEDDGTGHLVYEERAVREGDVSMMVPEGYGIAPFLKLQKMLARLFECLGYTVEYNCFDEFPVAYLVIVHNCADCLCNPGVVLNYSDMVPSCTLSEFLEWLIAKFMVQPIVNSESKSVRIVRINELLNHTLIGTGGFDTDISGLLEGDWTIQLNPSKRLVLTPTNDIEGTEPAAETFDKLIENYGSYVECSENQFNSLTDNNPAFYDCLVMRRATGEFYLLERKLGTGKMVMRLLGTNHFTYDRKNSDETEEHTQADILPLMLCDQKTRATAPFIGTRIHRHTAYNGSIDESDQKIIVVQVRTCPDYFAYPTTGTSQKDIPYSQYPGLNISFYFATANNYSLYGSFFSYYNEMQLNNPVHISGRVRYSLQQFLGLNMSELKLYNGQRLFPVKASAKLSERIGLTEVEFIKRDTMNGMHDQSISPIASTPLKWNMTTASDGSTAMAAFNNIFGIQTEDPPAFQYCGSSVNHSNFKDQVWMGMPSALGETKSVSIQLEITLKVQERYIHTDEGWILKIFYYKPSGKYDEDGNEITLDPTTAAFINEKLTPTKTYTFVAVSAS